MAQSILQSKEKADKSEDLISYFKKEYDKNWQELQQINKLCGQESKNPEEFQSKTQERAKRALEEMKRKKE